MESTGKRYSPECKELNGVRSVVVKFSDCCMNGIANGQRIYFTQTGQAHSFRVSTHALDKEINSSLTLLFPKTRFVCKVKLLSWETIQCIRLRDALKTINLGGTIRTDGDNKNAVSSNSLINALSTFVVLLVDYPRNYTSDHLLQRNATAISIGDQVRIHGVPFNDDWNGIFQCMTWKGYICGSINNGRNVFVIDSKSLPGIEGSVIFSEDGNAVGFVISCLTTQSGKATGLVLAGRIGIIEELMKNQIEINERSEVCDLNKLPDWSIKAAAVTVNVNCLGTWGTGIVLMRKYIITCAHVVRFDEENIPALFIRGNRLKIKDIHFVATKDSVFDVAIFELRTPIEDEVTTCHNVTPGDECYMMGYGLFSKYVTYHPIITQGSITNVNRADDLILMIQTDCLANGGCSGGGVFSKRSGDLLALVVSNLSDDHQLYPNANFCIPISHVENAIQCYERTKDLRHLRNLGRMPEPFQRLWLSAFNEAPRSKL